MTRLDGPDISHYQYFQNEVGNPDWEACRAGGCWWGATKLTQSTGYLDPTADRSRQGMRRAGFTHVGLYHWLSSTTDPTKQAQWYLKNLGELRSGEFVMLDAEEAGITVAMVLEWLECVEARTGRVGVNYSGAFVAGGTIWQSTAIRHSTHGPRPTILAAYTTEARAKTLPGVAAYPWSAWQYSSNGPVPGITGRCDMNRIDDRLAFDRAAGLVGGPTPVPAPIEDDDMPVTTNSDAYDDETGHHPAGQTKWLLRDDGTKLHISFEYWNALGNPSGVARPKAELDAIPDYVPVTQGGGSPAPRDFSGTISLHADG